MPLKRAILVEHATTLVQQNSDDYEEGLRAERTNEIKTQTQAPVKIQWRIRSARVWCAAAKCATWRRGW